MPSSSRPGITARTGGVRAVVAVAACLSFAMPVLAQSDPDALRRELDRSQGRLAQIRGERQRLQTELDGLAGQVHNVSEEIQNIERQIAASASLMAELDLQLGTLTDQVTIMTRDMLLTRDELTARQATLHQRLRDIYKRGPLRTVQVLLSSRSFSDLLNRYKYLHDVAMFDRMLVSEVEDLETALVDQREALADETDRMARVRVEKLHEFDELERLEQQRQRRLRSYENRQVQARSTLAQLATEEEQLRAVVAQLETRRRETEAAAGVASVSTLTTSDVGNLAWPVDGRILWRFGPQRDGNTTIPREGIGIGAQRGTPVGAVEAGTVASVVARTSGQTVILDHGAGFYSSYQKLQSATVIEGQTVERGQMIGRVGGEMSNPHIEFQIYEPGATGPRAVDPVRWLRSRP
ncbi:MAG: peptidoglycan DD-metalloendopeptidase family protein [Gemmatimonadetes bacterium]|nr:peptidoglycan DD-metalloendopeptidase family protein [Gemmatimonadota bacterium]